MSDLISKGELFNALATAKDKADCFAAIQAAPTVDAVPISVIESWLTEIAFNNTKNYLWDACEEIISRLGGLKRYYQDYVEMEKKRERE